MSETKPAKPQAERDTRLDLREELDLSPAIPHEPTPALMEIRLPAELPGEISCEVLRCPRCDSVLSERGDLGWCQRCGYCRYMERRKIVPAGVVRAQREALLHAMSHRLLPAWLGVLLCGMLVCMVSTLVAGMHVQTDARTRQAWFVAQATVTGLLLAMGHVAAFLRLVPRGQRRKHARLFVSPHLLWWGVWRRLPATQSSVWLAGWGLALAVGTAVVFVVGARTENWLWR